jgi:hypothetical protein
MLQLVDTLAGRDLLAVLVSLMLRTPAAGPMPPDLPQR